MAEKKKILYIVEAMGGGVFTYIVDLPCFEFTRSRTSIYSLWNFKVGIEWTDERNRTRTYKI